MPINSIDGVAIGSGKRGTVTEDLQSDYFNQVRGLRKENKAWHTYVS